MKNFKKFFAYLMVFALAFTFTIAIMPSKQVKAATINGNQYVHETGIIDDDFTGALAYLGPAGSYDSVSVDASAKTMTITNLLVSGEYADFSFYGEGGYSLYFRGTNNIDGSFTADMPCTIVMDSGSTLTCKAYAVSNITLGTNTVVSSGTLEDGNIVTFSSSASATTTETSAASTENTSASTAVASSTTSTPASTAETPATPANVQQAQQVIATAGTPNFSTGGVVAGNGVSVAGVSPITDGAALTQMTDLTARMTAMSGAQGAVQVQSAQAMDINATGSGRVNIAVGTAFAGRIAVVGHWHDGVLYFQQRRVKSNGYVDPYFSNFSPVIVLVTNQTTPLADIPTSEPGATTLSTSSSAPKTGEGPEKTILLIISMVALGTAIATYRRKDYE